MGEIDKHVSDGVNKLPVENRCDLTSQEELSTDEAKELADSLNLRRAIRVKDEIEDEVCSQDLSYKLKLNGFDDTANTKSWITKVLSSLRSNDDANSIVQGGVRMFNSTTPQYYHQQTCPGAQSYTRIASTHAKAGALVFSSSCLDERITLVGPGQYPQYTRAGLG